MSLDYDFRQMNARKRQTKRPPNPFDKTTIVSIFPKDIKATFVTLETSDYLIPRGTKEKPSITVIKGTSWWNMQGPNQPMLEVGVSSFDLANSIIRDSLGSMLQYKVGVQSPGLFVLPGEVTFAKLLTDHKPEIERAITLQNAWYEAMIRMADIDWPKSQGNPLVIDDHSRLAAIELGRKDKPWMGQFVQQELIPCVACGAPRNPKYPVCGSCHLVVDKALADKLQISAQKVG